MVELTSKVNTISNHYLERFGKVRVGIYHVVISQYYSFSLGCCLQFCLHFAYILCKQIVSRESNHQL